MTRTTVCKKKLKAALILQRKLNALYEAAYQILRKRKERRLNIRPILKARQKHSLFHVMFEYLLIENDVFKSKFYHVTLKVNCSTISPFGNSFLANNTVSLSAKVSPRTCTRTWQQHCFISTSSWIFQWVRCGEWPWTEPGVCYRPREWALTNTTQYRERGDLILHNCRQKFLELLYI